MMPSHTDLLRELQDCAQTIPTYKAVMERICQCLHEKITRYNWVGFYLIDPASPGTLVIGPFVGSFTPSARIPLNTGLCGAAASSGKTVVVHDFSKDPRYPAASPLVKCQIVVPIFAKKELAAELDIESYFTNTFTDPEKSFVEACAAIAGRYMEKA